MPSLVMARTLRAVTVVSWFLHGAHLQMHTGTRRPAHIRWGVGSDNKVARVRTQVVAFLMLGSLEYVVNKYALMLALAQFQRAVVVLQYNWYSKEYFAEDIEWVAPISVDELRITVQAMNGKVYVDEGNKMYAALVFGSSLEERHPLFLQNDSAVFPSVALAS